MPASRHSLGIALSHLPAVSLGRCGEQQRWDPGAGCHQHPLGAGLSHQEKVSRTQLPPQSCCRSHEAVPWQDLAGGPAG